MKWNGFGNGAVVCIAPLSLIVPDQIMMIMISSEVGTLSARPLLSLCAAVAGIVSAVTTAKWIHMVVFHLFRSFRCRTWNLIWAKRLVTVRQTNQITNITQTKKKKQLLSLEKSPQLLFASISLLVCSSVASKTPHLIGWPTQSDDFSGDLRQQTIVFLLAQQRDQSIDQYAKTLAGINGEHNVARQAL